MKQKKTYSIMESQHNLAQVVREVEAGYEVGITRRKTLVARMLPPKRTTTSSSPTSLDEPVQSGVPRGKVAARKNWWMKDAASVDGGILRHGRPAQALYQ